MKIAYKVSIGYADTDEFTDYSTVCGGWEFAIVEELNEEGEQSYVKCLTADYEFEKTVNYDEVTEAIAVFLDSVEALGRDKDLMAGTIQCAMDGDEDGLYEQIEDAGLEIDIIEGIPEEIDSNHDGRIFAIGEKYNISINSTDEVNIDLISSNTSNETFTVLSR